MSRQQAKTTTKMDMELPTPRDTVLSSMQLRNLKNHKYSCVSNSFLDPYMQKWWCWLVEQCPMWLAPNLITIVGLLINLVTTLILVLYSPDGKQEPPRWSCFLCALGLFIYQSLDAIDGKQARRTGSSSPLGELFDHGCDSVSVVCVALSACLAVQLGYHPQWMFLQSFCALTLFYCAHWQAYVSGTLQFGKFDVTEAQFGIIGIHLISTIFGPSVWSITVFSVPLAILLVICCQLPALASFSSLASYVCNGGVGKNGSTVAGTSVLSPAIPIGMVLVPAYVIAGKSPELYESHAALYVLAFGLVAAKVTNKLVIAHMSKSELNYLDSSMIGPLFVFLNQYFDKFFPEYYVLWLCMVWVTFDFMRYSMKVCYELCDYFNIYLFKIKSPDITKNGSMKKNGHAH
ncbi:choline/ethanolaminephosphotransferase 1-like isoform X4 [Artemia franciscana]|uniref:choline/ethanolaminephosphotransferase 1-like isoform X4 n=1 Tax=Artemia franciscana TaxID=6661 RepID=UPI0032DA8657